MVDLLTRHGALPSLLLLVLVAAACGGRRGGSGGRAEPPARSASADSAAAEVTSDEDDAPALRPIDRDAAHADDPGAAAPARRTSLGLVEEGKGLLVAGRPLDAARRLERATRIDPSNGFAWYWLGRARVDAGDPDAAIGILEKAETLLGPYPEWRRRAVELRDSLEGG